MTIIWCVVPEIWSMTDRFFLSFWTILPSIDPENQNFEKMKKKPWRYCHFTNVYHKWQSYDGQNFLSFWTIFLTFYPPNNPKNQNTERNVWRYHHFTHVYHIWQSYNVWLLRYGVWRTEFFVILDHFLHFYPPNNLKNQNFEKMKKKTRDITILHICTINDNHMMCSSWDIEHDRQNFYHFFPFYLHNNPKNQSFEKMKKALGDVIILDMFTINENHTMCGSWDIVHFLSFWTIFCSFTPLKTWKIKKFW